MAIIKCKMCGGDLVLLGGQTVAECEFCGSRQTVPAIDDEKKLVQFERAERLRKQCAFDKAAGVYEAIVADFRQEAEAYWGLVLCKFGIEYVDDPATGKKVPTCHRSSFDSIMEDSDLEQALENAEPAARKVYREEAKAIEEIRKGIVAVSNNEQPYDIFICYKETDPNGERTLDSVLAQDVYDVLTDKGYRVFFARISLEDKLGTEYEPYIFAALNSAKVMLVFGTDYEYFNAVWVKNEWSRFLKLMAADKTKHLIPCFKGIDAYDMPKEFARLQAQDLGKVGAVQDLLRGIEKLLPRKTNTTLVQEKVVVGGSGDNKVAVLLDRGNIALEDGDWAKADSFFEDVLNHDAKNAQAYLGKMLVQEKCRTMDAFVRKRKEASQNVRGQKLNLEPNTTHIDQMVARFGIPGYVEAKEIRRLYEFDVSYQSDVPERKQQYSAEQKYWQEHKLLSRAEQFAAGVVAENLQREKKALFAALSERLKAAEAAEAAEKSKVQAAYDAHIAQADAKAEQLYEAGAKRREVYYQDLLQIAKTSSEIRRLSEAAEKLDKLGAYKDSKNLAEHCRKRVAEEQEKLAAEAACRRQMAIKQEAAQRAKRRKILAIVGVLAVAAIAFVIVLNAVIIPNGKYNKAVALMETGEYKNAISAFEALDGYKDSEDKIQDCYTAILDEKFDTAVALMDAGQYEDAIDALEAIPEHKDSAAKIEECHIAILDEKYDAAVALMDAGAYEDAIDAFKAIKEHRDSAEKIVACENAILDEQYAKAIALMNAQKYADAIRGFNKLSGYKDSNQKIKECEEAIKEQKYKAAIEYYNKGKYEQAKNQFAAMKSYKDCAQWIVKCDQQIAEEKYWIALDKYKAGEYKSALALFEDLGTYKDSAEQMKRCEDGLVKTMQDYINTANYAQFVSYSRDLLAGYLKRVSFTPAQQNGLYQYLAEQISIASMTAFSSNIGVNQKYFELISDHPDAKNMLAWRKIFQKVKNDDYITLFKNNMAEIAALWDTDKIRQLLTSDGCIDYYLLGEWNTTSGYGSYYLKFYEKENLVWCSYNVPYPDVDHKYWNIQNMEFLFEDSKEVVARVYKLEFINANTLKVYSYKDSQTYILTRDFYTEGLEFGTQYNSYGGNTYKITDYNGSSKNVTIPATYKGLAVTTIADSAFYYCTTLQSVYIPNGVTTIEKNAFNGCSSLTTITLPDSLTTIGQGAFSSCSKLDTVYIGKNVTSIGSGAFSGCTSLKSIVYAGTIAQWSAIHKADSWEYNTGEYTVYCTDGTISM